MTSYVAYYRVSTPKQGQSGLGLAAQRKSVIDFVAGHGEIIHEFTEVESTKNDRPELSSALATCKRYKATLVIARLDRLARNVAFISNLMDSKIDFVAVDMPYANRLSLHVLAAVAEHEREMISKRTILALQAAKARGVKLGNPSLAATAHRAYEAITRNKEAHHASVKPILEDLRKSGCSLSEIAQELNERNVPTARGGLWYPTTVKNILQAS